VVARNARIDQGAGEEAHYRRFRDARHFRLARVRVYVLRRNARRNAGLPASTNGASALGVRDLARAPARTAGKMALGAALTRALDCAAQPLGNGYAVNSMVRASGA
jgi:hypothetical protein